MNFSSLSHKFSRSSAFTLVELMIVIAIISILAVVAMQLADDQTPAVDRERSIRFANAVQSNLSTLYSDMYLGRGVFTEDGVIFPDTIRLRITPSEMTDTYLSSTGEVISSGALLAYPFFDSDTSYMIRGLIVCDSGSANILSFTGGTIVLGKGETDYEDNGGNTLSQSIFQMTIEYRTIIRYIVFDRRVGMTEIMNKPYCQ